MNFNNLSFNPEDDLFESKENTKIHLRKQQRNGRKCITLIEGLENIDFKLLLKSLKKNFSCNGSLTTKDGGEIVIQLSGDQRENVRKHLVQYGLCENYQVVKHGA